jgi:hypothetical protein
MLFLLLASDFWKITYDFIGFSILDFAPLDDGGGGIGSTVYLILIVFFYILAFFFDFGKTVWFWATRVGSSIDIDSTLDELKTVNMTNTNPIKRSMKIGAMNLMLRGQSLIKLGY